MNGGTMRVVSRGSRGNQSEPKARKKKPKSSNDEGQPPNRNGATPRAPTTNNPTNAGE